VKHRDVVGGVVVPTVLGADWRARLSPGVALIHDDHAEILGEIGDRVYRRHRLAPHCDDRAQPGRREGEDWKALAVLLVIKVSAVVVDARHGGCPFAGADEGSKYRRRGPNPASHRKAEPSGDKFRLISRRYLGHGYSGRGWRARLAGIDAVDGMIEYPLV